jgi:hypothetical protein
VVAAAAVLASAALLIMAPVLVGGAAHAQAYVDSDGDGFYDPIPEDRVDACPSQPGVSPDGCPPPDRDGDGVVDAEDCAPDAQSVAVRQGANLSSVAQAHAPGTTFCIEDATYTVSEAIKLDSGDRWIGFYSDGSRPIIQTTTAHHIMSAHGSAGAYVEGLRLTGAVGNDECEPSCGRGIGGGANLHLKNIRADHNANQGVGGTNAGLLIEDSVIDHNGSPSFGPDGGPVSAAGVKAVNSYTVINSEIRNNYWDGLWCDIECDELDVSGSTISRNGKAGIHHEISGHTGRESNIENNRIQQNGIEGRSVYMGGLLIVGGENVTVSGNTFGSNIAKVGVLVKMDRRIDDADDSKDIVIENNTLNGDALTGCAISGVSCTRNN